MSQTDEKREEKQLASLWHKKFKDAMVHKAPYTKRWLKYLDAYYGEYFNDDSTPEYKSNMVSNYIFTIVETVRPIMLDNDPKFQAVPRQPEGVNFATDLQQALLYEWDREKMTKKLARELVNTLVLGSSVFFIPWDKSDKNVKGTPVNPFNIFPDPLATGVEDAEYIIYASYKNAERLKRKFPKKAEELEGGSINYSELVYENDRDANIDNQILVLEIWTTDDALSESEDPEDKENKRRKYPNGRVITLCPESGVILDDKKNPYEDKIFPFEVLKDYDVPGKFWGEGEVAQLLSPQKHINDLNNSIIDNAKTTANMPWIVDKNAGIGRGKITARPGLVIRKNPGTEVRREQPPALPHYVSQAIDTYKADMEQISGIHSSVKGQGETGVYTAQGILALQEAGQTRIRLKVKLLEDALSRMANMWFSRMKQFWNEDRWIDIAQPDGSYDLKNFTKETLKYDYNIKVTAGSTMAVNRGAMLDLMIRLAQTPMPDGQPLVDRQAVAEYLPAEVRASLMRRMNDENQTLGQLQEALDQFGEQLEQTAQESNQNDEEQFDIIEDITNTLDKLGEQILQVQQENDKIRQEKDEQEKEDKIRQSAYNEGYSDSEEINTTEQDFAPPEIFEDPDEDPLEEGLDDAEAHLEVPEEVLQGLENLTDDELAVLMEKHPEIMDLI